MTRRDNPFPDSVPWAGSLAATCAAALSQYDLGGQDIVVSLPSDVTEAVQISGMPCGGCLAGAASAGLPTDGGQLFIYGNGHKIIAPDATAAPLTLTGGARVTLGKVELVSAHGGPAAAFLQTYSYLLVGQGVAFTGDASNALVHVEAHACVECGGPNNVTILRGTSACAFEVQDVAYLECDPAVGFGFDATDWDMIDPTAYAAAFFRVMTHGFVGAIHLDWSKAPGKNRPLWFAQGCGVLRGTADALAAGWVKGQDPTFGGQAGEF